MVSHLRERLEGLKKAVAALEAEPIASQPQAQAVQEIILALLDPDPSVRRPGLEAITQLACRALIEFSASLVEAVVRTTSDQAAPVRAESAVVLALMPKDALSSREQLLERLLEDPIAEVRREAAAALGDVGRTETRGYLARHLDDPDQETRFEAAFALATLGDERGLGLLLGALRTSARRFDACEALRRLGHRDAVPHLWKMARSFFVGWPDRLSLWATLSSLGENEAGKALIGCTRAWSREERALALALIGSHRIHAGTSALLSVARDSKSPLQGTAVRALGELGDPAQSEALIAIAQDPLHPLDVRFDAVDAAARLPEPIRQHSLAVLRGGPELVERTAWAERQLFGVLR